MMVLSVAAREKYYATIRATVRGLVSVDSEGFVYSEVDSPGSEPWFWISLGRDDVWRSYYITQDGLLYHGIT